MVPRGFSDVLSSFLRSVVCVLDALPTVPALCACGWGGRRYRARPCGMLSAPPRPPRAAPVPLCHRRPSVGVSTFLCAGISVDRHSRVRSVNFSRSVEARRRGAVATYHARPAAPTAVWMVSASTWGAATAAQTSAPLRSAALSANLHLKSWTSLTSCGGLRPLQALSLHYKRLRESL